MYICSENYCMRNTVTILYLLNAFNGVMAVNIANCAIKEMAGCDLYIWRGIELCTVGKSVIHIYNRELREINNPNEYIYNVYKCVYRQNTFVLIIKINLCAVENIDIYRNCKEIDLFFI